jgi:hypothetical protein
MAEDEGGVRVNLRVEPELVDALDAEVERLLREQPGPRWSRSSVARMALIRHLREVAAAAEAA